MIARTPVDPVRVAIYCRKSVTEGLDQEFNTLHAQRDACEAYVRSQAGEGWIAIGRRYDDGGFSGSNTERPAFQALLRDIERGEVDAVAVYKIDRLSRSLRDFARLMDLFERHGVTFISVTQHFSTATSMGRLTLNMLMSFAEYEREVIGERIRDKKRATRRRGLWAGGKPNLGYDVLDKRLVVNPDEAAQVRDTFRLYVELGTLRETVAELQRRGWRNKTFRTRSGAQVGGNPFTQATLSRLLSNVVYRGQIATDDGPIDGVHEAIVEAELWAAVQEQLRANGLTGGSKTRNRTGALLRGLVRCGRCGSAMVHTFTKRANRRYGYYVCQRAHRDGADACPGSRVAAGRFETFVADQIRVMGTDEELLARTAESAEGLAVDRLKRIAEERRRNERQRRVLDPASDIERLAELEARDLELQNEEAALGDGTVDVDVLRTALDGFQPVWGQLFPAEQERILQLLIERITYDPDTEDVEISLRPCGIEALAAEAGVDR